MNEPAYTLGNEWSAARERLAQLEGFLDSATIEYMQRIGVGEGWRCLEVGGGGGSIAKWLSQRVGANGRVLATDLDTRFLDELNLSNLEVRRHNIEEDELPDGAFDLVHTRIVVVHLHQRERAIEKLTRAVKPGGWILLEEPDHVTTLADPQGPAESQALFNKVVATYHKAWRKKGQDVNIGNRILGTLRSQGFASIAAEGRTRIFQGGSSEVEFYRLTFRQLRSLIVESGEVGEQEFDRFIALFDDKAFAFRFFLVMSTWGCKPRA